MRTLALALLADESGQGLVEYSLILALVSIVAIAGLSLLGAKTNNSLKNSALTAPFVN